MIIITITLSIVYAFILSWLAYAWYKDMQYKEDTDKRILVLEKRINEVKKELTGQIQVEVETRQDFEEATCNEIAIIHKKIKKVSK